MMILNAMGKEMLDIYLISQLIKIIITNKSQ